MNDVWALLRMSRPELDNPDGLAEKFAQQRAMALEMAARNGLDLPEENILVENVSGQFLKKRTELKRLLELMHAGRCRFLIAPFEDRVDRLQDKREQAELEDALYAGGVTVISRDGIVRYDDELEPFPVEMRAAFARYEARKYSIRMRERKDYRLKQNLSNSAIPAYGLRKLAADDPNIYEAEYPAFSIMEEVFRRLLGGERLRSIYRDLLARQIPPPGVGKRKNAASTWHYSQLYDLVHNPIYAGFHCKRTRVVRNKGVRKLPHDQWILAGGEPGPWPKLLTLAEHYRIRAMFGQYRNQAFPRQHLLTGILHCAGGSPMRAGGGSSGLNSRSYTCYCPGERHNVVRGRCDDFARAAFVAFVEALPDTMLTVKAKPRRGVSPDQAYSAALARLKDKQNEYDRMVRESVDPGSLLRRFKSAEVDRIIVDLEKDLEQARATASHLAELVSAPDAGEATELLRTIRSEGAAALWDAATTDERRLWLKTIISRIILHPSEKHRYTRGADVVWQGWVEDYGLAIPVDPAWFPKHTRNRDYEKQNRNRIRDDKGRYI